MEILLAENAGFCFGVEKAVEEVEKQIANAADPSRTGRPVRVCTYGEIVHNEAVVQALADRGVRIVETAEDIGLIAREQQDSGEDACIVIRAHGAEKQVIDRMEQAGMRVIDATCPFVKRIHNIVREAGERGETVVVVGDPDHPEVKGIVGWAAGDVFVVSSREEATSLRIPPDKVITIVSQTTENRQKFEEIVEILNQREYNISIANTICNATNIRQREAERIASEVDVMIVVGGAHSSNTRKLYEISAANCAETYLVRNAGDLKGVRLKEAAKVGITAGASTPKTIIEEVLQYVRTGSVV